MKSFSSEIEPMHPSGICALCDNALEAWEPTQIVQAHGCKYLVHSMCAEEVGDDQ